MGRLVDRTCKPHVWQWPTPGDLALVCSRCGRSLPFAELVNHKFRRMRIAKGFERRHGKRRGEEFGRALTKTLNFYFVNRERVRT